MKTFPMFLRMDGRRVVMCGGGEEVARKARLILRTEARIVLVAEVLDAELQALVAEGRADHLTAVASDTFEGAALVFIGTGDAARDAELARAARRAGAVVNVIDQPALCDAFTPSIVDRDPLVVAIGTEGAAPVLGRAVRTEIETMLPPRLGGFVALAGRLRDAVAARVPQDRRRAFWQWAFGGEAYRAHLAGREREAARLLKEAVAEGCAPEANGHIALVGAGPGARDLLTLRAVQRLQDADVIFYDRLVDPEVLDLARRDADRVYVGKAVGANAWPQDKIDRLIVAEAAKGRRVVRLKSGDPSVFGRATEEMEAARAAGIAVEIVPGITAASAAAAAIGKHHLGLQRDGPRQRHPLALAARQGADGPAGDHHGLLHGGREGGGGAGRSAWRGRTGRLPGRYRVRGEHPAGKACDGNAWRPRRLRHA